VQVEIRRFAPDDRDEFFTAFEHIVNDSEGFPLAPPLTRAAFDDYWFGHASTVWIVRLNGVLAGGYYVKANFIGRAAHIANAGYFLLAAHRGGGLGRRMVEHSLDEARRLGFDAMQFNLVFASNPARRMYRELGFQEIGVIPAAVEGEDAVIYWRSLSPVNP
jgi:GNAT superfamily N-acetyltransferase